MAFADPQKKRLKVPKIGNFLYSLAVSEALTIHPTNFFRPSFNSPKHVLAHFKSVWHNRFKALILIWTLQPNQPRGKWSGNNLKCITRHGAVQGAG